MCVCARLRVCVQVMSKAASVFATWDDEYDKFSNVLRDVAKRKREEGLKFTWRVNPAHKRLQDRITKMTECVVYLVGCYGNTTALNFCAVFGSSTSSCRR